MRPKLSSLAAVEAGETVVIRRLLFDPSHEAGASPELREGDAVRCRAGGSGCLVLRTERGRTLVVERDRARFVQVEILPASAARAG